MIDRTIRSVRLVCGRLIGAMTAAIAAPARFGATAFLALVLCASGVAAQVPPLDDSTAADPSARADEHLASVPLATAVRLETAIQLDGRLDEEEWRRAAPLTQFTQTDPVEGSPGSERTEVYFMYDGRDLVGARSTLSFNYQLANYWGGHVNYTRTFETYDDRLTGGGPVTLDLAGNRADMQLNSDSRRPVSVRGSANYSWGESGGWNGSVSGPLSVRPAENWSFSLGPSRAGSGRAGRFDFGRDAGDVFRTRPDNVFLVEANYWLNF